MARTIGKDLRIDVKLVVLVAVLMGVLTATFCFWSARTHQEQMRHELVEQAQGFAVQMDAVWQFVDVNQDLINYNFDGELEYKKLHCSVAAKAVAQLFTTNSDYSIRYPRLNPRNLADTPDSWEQDALVTFQRNPGIKEYYQLVEENDTLSLRYTAPLRCDEGCLQCHGTPKGEIDITGYPKEGWSEGALAGAISIVIPADEYVASYRRALIRDLAFFLAMIVTALGLVLFAVRHLVTKPLHSLADGLGQVGQGELNLKLAASQSSKEMSTVVSAFNGMTGELHDLYTTLEQKVEDRTEALRLLNAEVLRQKDALEHANARLEEESAYKSEFLAVMSHELKTPLAAIITYLETLQSSNSSLSDEDRAIALRCDANSRELLNIINNILEVSRSQERRQKMTWEMVDAFDLVEFVLAEMEPLVQQKELRIVRDIDPETPLVYADWEKLRHILRNLLSNAVKFSSPGSPVVVRVGPANDEQFPGGIRFEVVDQGPGMTEEEADGIFDRFFQAKSNAQSQRGGTGLGLSIVQEFTQLHGGEAYVESELGHGSTFGVILPSNLEKRGTL